MEIYMEIFGIKISKKCLTETYLRRKVAIKKKNQQHVFFIKFYLMLINKRA